LLYQHIFSKDLNLVGVWYRSDFFLCFREKRKFTANAKASTTTG